LIADDSVGAGRKESKPGGGGETTAAGIFPLTKKIAAHI
jgi:hypothetical protein